MNVSDSEVITSVLLEEYGHFVDRRINSSDASGNEGDMFSRLVRGEDFLKKMNFKQKNQCNFINYIYAGELIFFLSKINLPR